MKKSLLLLFLVLLVYTNCQCDPGYMMLNRGCVPVNYIQGCHKYLNNGSCASCQYGYIKNCQICQPKLDISKQQCCVQRNQLGNCVKCANGLYLENGKCLRNIIDKCVYKLNGDCLVCGKGFVLNTNTRKCQPIIIGCEAQLSNGLCSRCLSSVIRQNNLQYRYQLSNGVCIRKKITSYNPKDNSKCKLKNSYGCIICQEDYYLTQDKQTCLPKYEDGCLIYFRGRCKQCSSIKGYILDQMTLKCIKKNTNQQINNCIQYDLTIKNTKCLACKSGYRLINNICVDESTIDCKIRKQCANGYILTSDYKCKQISTNLIKKQQQNQNQNQILIIRQPGCIYQFGKCEFCDIPFIKVDSKCTIPNCRQIAKKSSKNNIQSYECIQCRYPYVLNKMGNCQIQKCSKYQTISNKCVLCETGYHLKAQQKCVVNDVNCQIYNSDGVCEKCVDKYFVSSAGECMIKQSNCDQQYNTPNNLSICTSCIEGFFLNKHNQCQKLDINCKIYINGQCKTCQSRYFLYDQICFPYTIGCVRYNGKSCIECKKGYTLFNTQCYNLKSLGMKLQGQDDKYNFDIYPLDITKSKYYINNLSPASEICEVIYSSKYSNQYTNPLLSFEDENYMNTNRANGWKAQTVQKGQYIGYKLKENQDPVTFYALQLEFIQSTSIKSFYLEYTKDGINWIRVQNRFFVEKYINSDSPQYYKQNGIITIYFTGIYAKAIRIVIDEFVQWPACKIQFFYYDMLRYRKIMNLKSLRYLRQAIQTNFVDRVDNQLYINQKYFFDPQFECYTGGQIACFTGLELCEVRNISSIEMVNQIKSSSLSYVSEVYLTMSTTGRKYTCYKDCIKIQINQKDLKLSSNGKYYTYLLKLPDLQAKSVRVYPTKWVGNAKLSIIFDYE